MKPSEILREAVKLDWTQFAFARLEDGTETAFDDPDASCFCALGRIYRICPPGPASDAKEYLRKVVGGPIPDWNDSFESTRERVDAAFLEAAKLAESEGR